MHGGAHLRVAKLGINAGIKEKEIEAENTNRVSFTVQIGFVVYNSPDSKIDADGTLGKMPRGGTTLMTKLYYFFVLLFFLTVPSFALDNDSAIVKRMKTLDHIKQEVLSGRIPIYFDVSCDDEVISNKLKSLLASELRKKDNVKIVPNRNNAVLWLSIIAIGLPDNLVVISVIYGEDTGAFLNWLNPHEKWNIHTLNEKDILLGHVLYTRFNDSLGKLTSAVVDKFDVECIEAIRRNREIYLEKVPDAIK